MDPQQELFSYLLIALKQKYKDMVYDGCLPSKETPYPFIYLGDSQMTDDIKKNAVLGNVYQTIHVWHKDPHKRGTVSSMMFDIKDIARHIEHTSDYAWDLRNVEQRIIPDDTTNAPLLHGVLELEFKFSRR